MPDTNLAEDLARTLVDLYGDLQTRLAADLARRLAAGIDRPGWAEDKLRAVGQVRRWAQTLVERLSGPMGEQVAQAVVLAWMRGGHDALEELARAQSTHGDWLRLAELSDPGPRLREMIANRQRGFLAQLGEVRTSLPGAGAINRLILSLASKLQGTHLRILRWQLDAYREVIARVAATDILAGVATRRRAAQVAWEQLLSRGITGFVDRSGRRWELASYVEMATRSTVAQALVEAHLDRLGAARLDLVIVSNSPQECSRCRPWEGKVLTRSGTGGRRTVEVPSAVSSRTVRVEVAGSLDEAIGDGLLHPNCFPGDVLVSAPSGVIAADTRWYEGPLVVIHTAGGDELPVTPNHPVLTPEGWVLAGALKIGQRVLRYRGDVERVALGRPDDEQVPARIGDVFDALRKASSMPAVRVPVAPEQFHGDGIGSDVHVVLTDGLLRHGVGQKCSHGQLLGSGVRARPLLAASAPFEVLAGARHPAYGVMGGGGELGALLGGHSLGAPLGGLAAGNGGEAYLDPPADAALPDAESGRKVVLALAGLVEADQVIDLSWREFAGHVYNLQTGDGWYVASGIVVHNCTHRLNAYLPGATRIPQNTANPEGDAARQQLRALERKLRKAKLQAAAVIDPAAKKAANAKVRDLQAQIRAHVADTGLIRQPAREQIGVAR